MTAQQSYYFVNGAYHPAYSLAERKQWAFICTPSRLADIAASASSIIPPKFFVATAYHETGDLDEGASCNQVDVEPSGFTSRGMYQQCNGMRYDGSQHLDEADDHQLNLPSPAYYNPITATMLFAVIMEERYAQLYAQWRRWCLGNNPDMTSPLLIPPPDIWGYLALGHNEGMGTPLKSIALHGMDVEAYIKRNDPANGGSYTPDGIKRIGTYMRDCMTGGPWWAKVQAPGRVV